METLKKLCPLEIVKTLGQEALWLYQTAQAVRQSVVEMTFESEEV